MREQASMPPVGPAAGDRATLSFIDTDLTPGKEVYYYVRVTTKGGAQAWSSPFWVKWPE